MIKPTPTQARATVAMMVLAASTLVGIAVHEDYREEAYIPVPGDVPTIGFGSTAGVRMGDKTTPTRCWMRSRESMPPGSGVALPCRCTSMNMKPTCAWRTTLAFPHSAAKLHRESRPT